MGPSQSHIESLAKRGWVKHLGYLDNTTLMRLYRDAFALVWPSFYEGFGLPVVESMSQGTPVITSNRTSLSEIGGAAAIYCDPHSIDSICEAMLRLEENKD
ncbi:MAG: glycosyltransferase, partial [Planctomycetota bacterium]|nr:glycosyltransferase [Planctomycetota bacterium]